MLIRVEEPSISTPAAGTALAHLRLLCQVEARPTGAKTHPTTPGNPWENGYVEGFNGKLRDRLLNREVFDNLCEV